jgi:hypothetical protein
MPRPGNLAICLYCGARWAYDEKLRLRLVPRAALWISTAPVYSRSFPRSLWCGEQVSQTPGWPLLADRPGLGRARGWWPPIPRP